MLYTHTYCNVAKNMSIFWIRSTHVHTYNCMCTKSITDTRDTKYSSKAHTHPCDADLPSSTLTLMVE